MKRAYLVLGPESSATRMMARQLVAVGCYGDSDHVQRLDTAVPDDEPLIVWRRSIPYAGEWPKFYEMVAELSARGYDVTAVVMVRDYHCMAISQEGQHTADVGEALKNIHAAYLSIFDGLLMTDARYELISYEALVLHPPSMRYLLRRLGLPEAPLIAIHDGNQKYYE